MPVRVRYNITFSISSTPAEERDLANPQYEIVTDTQEDGGISKTLVSPGQQNVPLNILNLSDAGFLVVRINSRDPTLPPNQVILGINNPGEVQISSPSLPTLVVVNSITNSSGTVSTVTTYVAHNLAVGNIITIAGNTNALFNGTFTVASIINSTSFTFNQTVTPTQTGTGGTIQADLYGLSNTSGTTTVTCSFPHGFSVGNKIVVFGTTNDTVFSGVFTIASVPSTTTFTYTQSMGSYPQFANGGTAQILGASEITVAPLGDATEGHMLLSTQGTITSLYASNPGTTPMEVTVSVAGPLP